MKNITLINDKVMTQEEKAKAYDEAIERAKKWYDAPNVDKIPTYANRIIEELFPALVESEDEKIRKALVEMVHDTTGDELWIDYNVHKEDALVWLEKQGEHANFRNKIQIGDKVTRNEDGALVNLSQLKRVAKPTDKVEPKFKVGDFVVIQETTYLISKIEGLNVTLSLNGREGIFDIDVLRNAHLYTIQDAKAGDILSYENEIFIVKKSVNINILYYCCYDREHFIIDSFYSLTIDDIGNITPATKEQRELLHSKIKEAGYEWDADALELKKIKPELWSDRENKKAKGYYIDYISDIIAIGETRYNRKKYNLFATKKQAKSALAMAMISQIMANDIENFGGAITDEEWENDKWKAIIYRSGNRITTSSVRNDYYFLAFHTEKQRDLFLEKYPQLVHDFLMITDEKTK